jgi:medium-chain acyl-[acyl-carrier-protein] hydrolase
MDTLVKEYNIEASQCDRFGRLSPQNMLNIIQEISDEHTTLCGFGREPLAKENAVWVLVSHELHILRYPEYMEKIRVSVYPKTPRRTLFPRYTAFESEKGERLIDAASLWTIMDINTLAMKKLPWVAEAMPKNTDKKPPIRYPSSAARLDENAEDHVYSPRFSDYDINGHINNTRCVLWLTDLLGEEILHFHPIEKLCINYNKELRGNEDITLRLAHKDLQLSLSCIRDGFSHVDLSAELFEDGKDTVSKLAASR